MRAAAGKSMAGAIKLQTRPGRGRSRNSWADGGTHAASMSNEQVIALELAAATGNPAARNRRSPGEPGVTARRGGGTRGGAVRRSPDGTSPSSPAGRAGGSPGGSRKAPASGNSGKPGNPGVTTGRAGRKAATGSKPGEPGPAVASTPLPPGSGDHPRPDRGRPAEPG